MQGRAGQATMEKRSGGGELAELKKELRTLAASRSKEDLATKRELFKRIISCVDAPGLLLPSLPARGPLS